MQPTSWARAAPVLQAGQVHVEAGMKLRKAGELEQALVEFQKAFSVDPGSSIALQEIKQTTELLDQKQKGQPAAGRDAADSGWKSRARRASR